MPVVDVAGLAVIERLPGWHGRFFHSDSMTFGYWDIAAGAAPLHEHHHEQEEVWHVVEGELVLTVDGAEHVITAGGAVVVPPNVAHSARPVGACRAIVVDHPRRDEIAGHQSRDGIS